jgi:hypothetical protein
LREAADGGERKIFLVSNSAYALFVHTHAAIAELLELRQTFWKANLEYKTTNKIK